MDYFLMNECVLKILIKKKKTFTMKLLKSLDIDISKYTLFDLNIPKKNMKVDIILYSKNKLINIELNKEKRSLHRNQIFYETIAKLLPELDVIQLNINLFKTSDKQINIYNYTKGYNEYIDFITCKDYQKYNTTNPIILDVIEFLRTINQEKIKKEILHEQEIKSHLDNLLKY